MIVKATKNLYTDLPINIGDMGFPESSLEGKIDITVGWHYKVYAIRRDEYGSWYFVHTDTENLDSFWWMPASLYEIVEDAFPRGWVTQRYSDKYEALYSAYLSLFDGSVEAGILDGDADAIKAYMEQVLADSTFPSDAELDSYNKEFMSRLKQEKIKNDLKLAEERGYELPVVVDDEYAR